MIAIIFIIRLCVEKYTFVFVTGDWIEDTSTECVYIHIESAGTHHNFFSVKNAFESVVAAEARINFRPMRARRRISTESKEKNKPKIESIDMKYLW